MRIVGRDAARGRGILSLPMSLGGGGSASAGATFPDASNTGYSGVLTTQGATTVSTDGTVIGNKKITGRLTINADNVTIRNVHVQSLTDYYVVMVYGQNCLIEDATCEGSEQAQASIAAVNGGQFIARRVNCFGAMDGVTLSNNSELRDSYIHDLSGDSSSHNDGVNADGFTGWTVDHCTILNDREQTSCIWVGDPRNGASAGYLTDCLLAGGGYSVYAGPGTSDGIHVTGNRFSTRFFAKGGFYGPVTAWSSANNEWGDNLWLDGANAGQPVSTS